MALGIPELQPLELSKMDQISDMSYIFHRILNTIKFTTYLMGVFCVNLALSFVFLCPALKYLVFKKVIEVLKYKEKSWLLD